MKRNKWYEPKRSFSDQGLIIDEVTGENIAVTYKKEDAGQIIRDHNAAPDMLEALEKAQGFLLGCGAKGTGTYAVVSNAISKALGE